MWPASMFTLRLLSKKKDCYGCDLAMALLPHLLPADVLWKGSETMAPRSAQIAEVIFRRGGAVFR